MNTKSILIVTIAACAAGVVQAAYAPQFQESQSALVSDGIANFRKLPQLVREAYFAEKLGLLFLPNGESGYALAPHRHLRAEQVKLTTPKIHAEALFVGCDGEQHEYAPLIRRETMSPAEQEAATQALTALYQAKEEALLQAFADEVTQLCLNTARNRMATLPSLAREALLAELGGWVYKEAAAFHSTEVRPYPTGLYSCGRSVMRINHHEPRQKYMDSHGQVQDFGSVVQAAEQEKAHAHTWKLVLLTAQYIGAGDILALYPEEAAAMRRYSELRNAK